MPLTDEQIKALLEDCKSDKGKPWLVHLWKSDLSAKVVAELCTRLLEAEAALAEIRETLAATDIVSLPDDYPTARMAHDRMERIKELTLQGLAEIGRREAAQARVKVLEGVLAQYPNEEHAAVLEAGK